MHSNQEIEDLAKELGIDSGTSSSSDDRMRKIAESVGMDKFNPTSDANELENRLRNMQSEKNRRETSENETDTKENQKGKGTIKAVFKSLPLQVKLIIIGIIIAIIFFLINFLILFSVFVEEGLIKIDDTSLYAMGSSYYVNSDSYWWPIGSENVTTKNGKTFAIDTPENTIITSRHNDTENRDREHKGIDIANYRGNNVTNIIASKAGEVVYPIDDSQTSYGDDGCIRCERSNDGGGYGNYVKILHPNGDYTIYAHLAKDSITVRKGDTVEQGEVIGKMGNSGNTNGTHLHFEIISGNTSVDPLNYIKEEEPRPISYGSGNSFSLVSTTLSNSEFTSKMNDYCSRSGNKNFCENFSNHSDLIYSVSNSNGVNPELVVVTAGTEQGWSNPNGSYNYWGIGVSNGSNDVGNFGSLEAGIKAYANTLKAYSNPGESTYNMIVKRYNERENAGCSPSGHGMPGTLEGMQSVYSWIGTYRFNPGSSGLGGCYYLNIIYGNNYCSSVTTCSTTSNCPVESKTTTCEQNDYTAYQLKGKANLRLEIFGL